MADCDNASVVGDFQRTGLLIELDFVQIIQNGIGFNDIDWRLELAQLQGK